MARKRFHQLKKVKFRATWNKYNLYNLSRLQMPRTGGLTFFQQKWKAKSISRAYHGEQIREKQWQRMFTPRLNAVVPMDHKYLAEFDGSELAAGRGSGLEQPLGAEKGQAKKKKPIPYMHQTYAPIERRLDMAVWRALFASSARQARQFVVHGKVKVNGKKMIYPGYLLNPGDLFQVEPESVLFATGAPKDITQKRAGKKIQARRRGVNVSMEKLRTQAAERRAAQQAERAAKKDPSEALIRTRRTNTMLQDNLEYRITRQRDIAIMIEAAEKKMNQKRTAVSVKVKQKIRAFLKHAKKAQAEAFRKPIQDMEKERYDLVEEYRLALKSPKEEDKILKLQERDENGTGLDPNSKDAPISKYRKRLSEARLAGIERALAQKEQEVVDPTKPYATPWRPRDYMSAFAFIPRYLEVNSKICAAVYLRHPVARPGLTEVPTPFPADIQQLAFTWYLRRR
ncbi:related to NAM9-mitochondrial ribosomal protein, small subunit [Phialocephala subalpina]|uniref:Related to NAM9-mitochondrial ribosomal protein, small subunit n=1 Tax=Phialocephala subalpina TaxID=576137 RepID=A0A1L7XP50_9HELO|nr:related to NAM9-mitochondrial ribosomal protein, small subunit [Phialocephala subalpina]